MVLLLPFITICCNNVANKKKIDCVLTHALSNYYESNDSQEIKGYYPRQYLLAYSCVNNYDENLYLPLSDKNNYSIKIYYKDKELLTYQRFYIKNKKANSYKDIFLSRDTLFIEIEIFEATLKDANVPPRIKIKEFLDSINIIYHKDGNLQNPKGIAEGSLFFINNQPHILYTDTKRQSWEEGPIIIRLGP